jgi:putative ABC transport system permease protein
MRIRWNKIIGDLRLNAARSFLVVLAIAIGLAGFGALLSTYSILTRELNSGYLATNPASATLYTDAVDDELLQALQHFRDIHQVERRRSVSARLRTGPNEWRNAILFILNDFQNIQINIVRPQLGKWPPMEGEILIERDALGVAGAKIGNTIIVKTSNGSEQALRISGTVQDVGQAQARMEQIVYGYITLPTLIQLGESPYFDQIKIVVTESKRKNEEQIHQIVGQLKRYLAGAGHPVRRVDIPTPEKHPHADLMGTLLLFQASFGLFALFLSGSLVMNLFYSLMAGQIRQIGIMKAIGASRIQIIGLYLSQVLLLGLMAVLIALPISILAGRAIATFMSHFLNFDLKNNSIPFWVFFLEFSLGLLVPLLAAFLPIWKGSRITVREAITDYGISQTTYGSGRIDRMIAGFHGTWHPFLLSLRNTFRRRARLLLTLLTLAAGGAIFISAWNVRASFVRTTDLTFQSLKFDIAISFSELYPIGKLEQTIRQTPGVKNVESWSGAEATVLVGDGSERDSFRIAGLPPRTNMLSFNIVEGRGLRPEDQKVLVINSRLSKDEPLLKVGQKVRLRIGNNEEDWLVAGMSQEPFSGPVAYGIYDSVANSTNQIGQTKNVRIVCDHHDRIAVNEIRKSLEKNLADAGWKTSSATTMAERRIVIDEHNSVIYAFLILMSLLVVFVGGLGLMTIMSINVLERRREIGILRAIGATHKALLLILLSEGSLIGAFSWLLSIPPAFLISNSLGNFVANMMFHAKLESAFDPLGVVVWLILTLLFGAAASFLPAQNASRMSVRELIEYE